MPTISAVIIAKNEEKMIANCLDTLQWCDECIVIDNGSTDSTPMLAEQAGAHVIELKNAGFAEARTKGKDEAKSDWILYIDADERVTPKLKSEVQRVISSPGYQAYSVPRNNIHYGKWMQYGGWEKDRVVRLFQKKHLSAWEGKVHEHAIVDGVTGELREPLVHLTHRNMKEGLEKSIVWTDIEAHLFLAAGHPNMTTLRLIKVTLWEFFSRVFKKKAYKDGTEGMIEAMVQAMNRFLVYERVWELQRKPSLDETYQKIEKEIASLWRKQNG
ncbi:MAG TPA: hypothetical protein DCX25_03690 [Candidatus Pacebacteria bacterium]|nr:MAG: Glycosyl transferase family 2 [Microgenomates group bacterium GW2011_GWB1_45_17]KKU23031.1 MAG: Glycosyl transferase family 2 [Microgenomates group bacterium GW2011_GWA1_46_15]KKU24761.1 MAG: Glycosyl transferase family 2 [Microgenomates group bacterium GW2011_GWC1_46_15]HAV15407.1 hypothetical protein [Candidatus Paceibacterota bacterium]HCR11534.1 hypothetical protein [Candidatus Paceibacterota bacterium]